MYCTQFLPLHSFVRHKAETKKPNIIYFIILYFLLIWLILSLILIQRHQNWPSELQLQRFRSILRHLGLRRSGSTLGILSSPLCLQIHRGWARILNIPLRKHVGQVSCRGADRQFPNRSDCKASICSFALIVSSRHLPQPFWLHCGLFFFPLWTRVPRAYPDCSTSPFGLVWSCLGAMNLSGFRTTDRGFEKNVTFDRGYVTCSGPILRPAASFPWFQPNDG